MSPRPIISLDLDDAVRALRRVPLFDGVEDDELATVARWSHVLAFDDGEVIVPEGEEALGFYVVLGGRVRVLRGEREVAVLDAGDFFGEIALLRKKRRSATVSALGRTTVLGILRASFKPMLTRNPRVALRILEAERKRGRALR